jgi:F-type H+-transporting ATPase subunit b
MKRSLLISAAVAALTFGSPAFAQHADPPHGESVHATDQAPTDHAPSDHAPSDHTGAAHAGHAGMDQGEGHDVIHPRDLGQAHGQAHGEGHGADGEHHALKPINWLDFSNKEQAPYAAMFLNFLILVIMYYVLGKKPVAEGLKNRRASIAKEIEEAQRMRKEAEDRALVYQKKLEHLEDELKETRAALIEAGKGDRDRIVREAEEKATRMEKDAAFLVEQEIKQLRADLMREAVEVAVTTAEELLKKRVTPVDQERLAEDYLAQLVAKNKPSASMPPRTSAPPAAPTQGGQS